MTSQIKNKPGDSVMVRSLKASLKELVLNSTSHGIPQSIRTRHTSIRVMWLVLFVISTGFCSFLIVQSVLQYFEFEVITKIRVINEVESEFPRITICNGDIFNTEYGLEVLYDAKHLYSNLSQDTTHDWVMQTINLKCQCIKKNTK